MYKKIPEDLKLFRGPVPKDEHPLHKAIRIRKKAIRANAHPKIIEKLNQEVSRQANISLDKLGGSTQWIDDLSDQLTKD